MYSTVHTRTTEQMYRKAKQSRVTSANLVLDVAHGGPEAVVVGAIRALHAALEELLLQRVLLERDLEHRLLRLLLLRHDQAA